MRLDILLSERKYFSSRQKAKDAIISGTVKVNGVVCTKPSMNAGENCVIEVGNTLHYVGRGGLKLEKLVSNHNIRFDNMVCMDIGASTGGFTDCMLQNGAEYVYAVDVGSDQLAESLKNDKRVCNMEKTDIRNITQESIERKIDFISVDVSFISLKLILPKVYELLDGSGTAAVLIKPQFEAGRENIGKNGIVKSQHVHENILNDIIMFSQNIGFEIMDADYSPVTGGKGNIEYLMLMKKGNGVNVFDIHSLVRSAFDNFKTGGKA